MTLAQLESDLRAAKDRARTLIDATALKCRDHVVRAATATEPAITGRLMTAEERSAIDAALKDAEAIQTRIDGMQSDAALIARLDKIAGGNSAPTRPASDGPARSSRDRKS